MKAQEETERARERNVSYEREENLAARSEKRGMYEAREEPLRNKRKSLRSENQDREWNKGKES